MKKKIIGIMLALSMTAVMLAGCGDSKESEQPQETEQSKADGVEQEEKGVDVGEIDFEQERLNRQAEQVDTEHVFQNAEIKTAPVKSGSGEVIGKRAYVEVSKEDAKKVPFNTFVTFQDYTIKDADYNYFTICFDDGTGIVYAGCVIQYPYYGKIDDTGSIIEAEGYLEIQDDKIVLVPKSE